MRSGRRRTRSTLVGVAPRLFRPPGGSFDDAVLQEAERQRMRVVTWSVDPRDWISRTSSRQIVHRVLGAVEARFDRPDARRRRRPARDDPSAAKDHPWYPEDGAAPGRDPDASLRRFERSIERMEAETRAVIAELRVVADPVATPGHGTRRDQRRAIDRVSRSRTSGSSAGVTGPITCWHWISGGAGIHEARILASMVDDPADVTRDQMDAWVRDFDSWDICDQVVGNLFDLTPLRYPAVRAWTKRDEEFVKRAGFAMIATHAVHDRTAHRTLRSRRGSRRSAEARRTIATT